MDPWADSGSNFLTSHFEKSLQTGVIPLVKKAIALGMPVLILTNSPGIDIAYSSKIHPELEKLTTQDHVYVIYHQTTNSELFSQWLRGMSIDTLIYSGFASNVCLIGRDLGMIPMQIKGFRLFLCLKHQQQLNSMIPGMMEEFTNQRPYLFLNGLVS
jgi:hypothetical protein